MKKTVLLIVLYQIINSVLIFILRKQSFDFLITNESPYFSISPELFLILSIFGLLYFVFKKNMLLSLAFLGSINNIFEYILYGNVLDYIRVFEIGTININDVAIYIGSIYTLYLIFNIKKLPKGKINLLF